MQQITLDGELVSYPLARPRHLTERQRDLLRWMRTTPPISTGQARRFYADASGALGRLETMGLVKRVERGKWRPA